MKHTRNSRQPLGLIALASAGLSAHSVQAASQTWTNSGSDSLWNATSSNWTGAVWTNNNDAVFGATGIGSIAVDSSVIVNDITFGTAGYTLTGNLKLSNDLASTFTLNAEESISAVIENNTGGASSLTKTGSGKLTLSGANTYTGDTIVNFGTLSLTGSLGSTALSMGGGTFSYDRAGTNTQSFTATTLTGGFSSIYNTVSTNTLDLGALARTAGSGGSVNFSSGTGTIKTSTANSNGILGGWATVGNGGATADWAAVDGSGNIVTYTGYTAISSGANSSQTLSETTASQNWQTSSGASGFVTTLNNSGTINSLVVQGDVIVGAGNTLTLGSGGLILSGISRWIKGPNGNTSDTGQLTSGLASGELFVDVASSAGTADNWRIWTKIVNNGGTAVKFVKTGPGFVDLSNANSYTGGTYLNSGTLGVSNNSGLGTGALTMAGGTLNITKAGANIDLANDIVMSGSNNHIYLGVARNLGLNGSISGSGQLTLGNSNHNSSIYLSGANTMTSGTITLVNNTNSVRFANANAGNANVSWVINNTTANRNTLDFASGTISFGSMTGNGIVQSNGAGTKTISAGALGLNDTFSGVIANGSGTLALTKVGSGTMTLSGNNSYNGATSVNAGTLKVSGSIGNSAVTVSNSGTVLASGTTGTIGSSVAVNSGAILAAGDRNAAGTATVNGVTTFNDGSIFSWDISSTGTSYDKLISTSLVDGNTAGGSILQIVAADANFSDPFWSTTRTWVDIFTTNGTTAISNWANIFSSVSVVNGNLNSITPVNGSFSVSGSTLTWSAVPEPTTFLSGLLLGAGLLRRRRN